MKVAAFLVISAVLMLVLLGASVFMFGPLPAATCILLLCGVALVNYVLNRIDPI